jgi:hypothetical protein
MKDVPTGRRQSLFLERSAMPDWLEAQQELVRLRARVSELEKQTAGLLAQRVEACGQFWLAIAQSTDDQITLQHLRAGLETLGESEERFMIPISELYEAMKLDYIVNRKRSLRSIEESWKNHLAAAFGELPAAGLTSDRVTEYIAQRQAEGASNATINRETHVCSVRSHLQSGPGSSPSVRISSIWLSAMSGQDI